MKAGACQRSGSQHLGKRRCCHSRPASVCVRLHRVGRVSDCAALLDAFLVQLFFAGRIALIERSIVGRGLAVFVGLVGESLSHDNPLLMVEQVAILAFGGALALLIVVRSSSFFYHPNSNHTMQFLRAGSNALKITNLRAFGGATIDCGITDARVGTEFRALLLNLNRKLTGRSKDKSDGSISRREKGLPL